MSCLVWFEALSLSGGLFLYQMRGLYGFYGIFSCQMLWWCICRQVVLWAFARALSMAIMWDDDASLWIWSLASWLICVLWYMIL